MENLGTLCIYVKHFFFFSISSLTMNNTEAMLIMMNANLKKKKTLSQKQSYIYLKDPSRQHSQRKRK